MSAKSLYNNSKYLWYYMNIDRLREAFADAEFTAREASTVLGTSTHATRTLLGELRVKGHLVRVARGRYRVADYANRWKMDQWRVAIRLDQALATSLQVALDGPDAVAVWTGGRYRLKANPNAIYVAVAAADEAAYRTHLADAGLEVGDGLRSPHVVLRVVPAPAFTTMDGTPVLARAAVLELIREYPIAYDGAEQWLR